MTEQEQATSGVPLNLLLALVAFAAGAVAVLVVTLLAVSTLG
ncbi:MAG TPA: hypothetical protein VFK76_06190 [Gaiellaceae bacterium]|nr:hypothetical protein [Gaiellaceae bacterium]